MEVTPHHLRFAFGKNWQDFLQTRFSAERLIQAAHSLQELLDLQDLVGKTFVDIGCGSGLFSLAACMLGARQVVSFDYDQNCVQATTELRSRAGISVERWRIMQGSILDTQFLAALPASDIVYSWGVLHHTGAMWPAIENTLAIVKPGGLLAIAIYNRVDRLFTGSRMAWRVKWLYNASPVAIQRLLEVLYAGLLLVSSARVGQSPLTVVRETPRGMDFWIDVRDWVGGFPYEYASPHEVCDVVSRRGFESVKVRVSAGLGCNEFVFRFPANSANQNMPLT